MDTPQAMTPEQACDFTVSLFQMARYARLLSPGGQVQVVTPTGNKQFAVTFEDGTRAVITVTVHRAPDGGQLS